MILTIEKKIFILILLIVFVSIYLSGIFETFVNSGLATNDDITPTITTAMNYNNSVVSTISNYPNDLSNNLNKSLEINKLRTFKSGTDGPNEKPSLYKNIVPNVFAHNEQKQEKQEELEEFTMMNPINLNY